MTRCRHGAGGGGAGCCRGRNRWATAAQCTPAADQRARTGGARTPRASPTGALLSCNACRLSPCTPAPLQQLTRPTPRPSSQRPAAPSSALGIRSKLSWSVPNLLMGIFCVSSALLRAQIILDLGSPEHRPLILSFSLTNRMIASLCPVRQSTLQPAWESFHRKFQSFNRKREILSLGTA